MRNCESRNDVFSDFFSIPIPVQIQDKLPRNLNHDSLEIGIDTALLCLEVHFLSKRLRDTPAGGQERDSGNLNA